jgi:uncharacterized protein YjbJ (UPF0337 family)
MTDDRIHGAVDQTKGIWKETSGKITGDRSTEVSGKLDQAKGKVEEKVGDAKEAVRRGDEPDR